MLAEEEESDSEAGPLAFDDEVLEAQYRDYQHDLASQHLFDRWGSLSMTSISSLVPLTASLVFRQNKSDSLLHTYALLPFLCFNINHQWVLHSSKRFPNYTEYRQWVLKWAILAWSTEILLLWVNEQGFGDEKCWNGRFICPNPLIGADSIGRSLYIQAIVILHLTTFGVALHWIALLASIGIVCRVLALFIFADDRMEILWSLAILAANSYIFVFTRYKSEVHGRKKFLLQIHISRLRSQLQCMLDNMMPRCFSERVMQGELFVDPYQVRSPARPRIPGKNLVKSKEKSGWITSHITATLFRTGRHPGRSPHIHRRAPLWLLTDSDQGGSPRPRRAPRTFQWARATEPDRARAIANARARARALRRRSTSRSSSAPSPSTRRSAPARRRRRPSSSSTAPTTTSTASSPATAPSRRHPRPCGQGVRADRVFRADQWGDASALDALASARRAAGGAPAGCL